MGNNTSKDWELRIIDSAADNTICPIKTDCIDLISRTKTQPGRTFNYCGTGKRSRLHSVTSPTPTPSTGTFRGDFEDLEDAFVEFYDSPECPLWFQLVSCATGRIYHYSGVYLGDRSAVNPLTALGVGAEDAPLLEDISIQFDRIVRIYEPEKVPLGQFVSDGGYYEGSEVYGNVNGSNCSFRLPDEPVDGYPVRVYADGVLQTVDVDYTIDGDDITFVVCPECDVVITADYYTEEYLIHGLCPTKIMYCSESCGDRKCGTCQDLYAIYQTSTPIDPDVCGISDGFKTAVGLWTVDNRDGSPTLESVSLLDNVANVIDGVCTSSGEIVLAAENGLFEGCSGAYSQVAPAELPSGASIRKLAYSYEQNRIYALYNNSGVLLRKSSGRWGVSIADGQLTTQYQNDIDAESDTIVTVGEANTVQISQNNGITYNLRSGAGTVANSLVSVAIGAGQDVSNSDVLLSVLMTDTNLDQTTIHVSGDWSQTWSGSRKTWGVIAVNMPDVQMYEDWLVYVMIDGELWRNTARACDKCGAWEQLIDTGFECSAFAFCTQDPNKVAVYSRPTLAAVQDSLIMSGTLATVATVDVLANDYNEDTACPIDPSTLAVAVVSDNISGSVAVAVVGNELEVTVNTAIAADTQGYVEYTVETTCGDELRGLAVIDFLA